ncbi:MAG: CpaF family protein [Candidatus Omnitrophica bacterium]|nr:CpaF family protein [Candidatus Omnitrophota bacterium]
MDINNLAPSEDSKELELTNVLLDRLRGRLTLIQPTQERFQIAFDALEVLYAQPHNGRFPSLTNPEMRRAFIHRFLLYDCIEEFLEDPSVEDIVINATNPIFLHRTQEGLVKTNKRIPSAAALVVFVKKLVVFAGRSEVDPINNLELFNIRGRVNIIQSPFGAQITITRGKPQPFTMLQLIHAEMLSHELAALLWMYVEGLRVRPANLIIAGGPGTGKTTLLNALLSFIPWQDRVVTIEDTLELNTTFIENCSRLESCRRVKTPELVKNSLRMRPDRILVGEVRGLEANDLMTTMNLGKYCMGTLHASSARETILRLQNEPMNVPPVLIPLVDVFIILRKRNRAGAIHRIVSEVVETSGMEQQVVLLSTVWNYDNEQQETVEFSPSSTYRDRLAAESGQSPMAIMQEIARRSKILKCLATQEGYSDIASLTKFCQLYSEKPDEAIRQLGIPPEALKVNSPKAKR